MILIVDKQLLVLTININIKSRSPFKAVTLKSYERKRLIYPMEENTKLIVVQ